VSNWLGELRRRNVHRVLVAYGAAAWLMAQVAGLLAEAYGWPTWVLRALVTLLLLGIPVAALLAWFFELTPAGLVREQESPATGASLRVRPHRGLDVAIVALIALAIGYFALTHDWRGSDSGRTSASRATLAVLPFKPIVLSSSDQALEFGMTDTLITRLSGIADVVVRPLSSVRRYSALEQDPIAAGRELDVGSVLDGTVQKSGERLRVTARLLSVADGRQLWSEQFDENYTDIFAVQDSIANRVTRALSLRLSEEEEKRFGRHATDDAVAYDLYLNGRYYWNRRASPDDLRRAIEFYSRAVERDPRFALAYSGLADALAVLGIFGVRAPQDVYPKALAASERALELDPELAEAHATRGHIRLSFRHDWQGALEDYDEALRHDPRYSTAHMWRGFWFLFVGRNDVGLEELAAARDLEPDQLILAINYARGLYWSGRHDDAQGQLARVLEIAPENGTARALLVGVLTQRGRFEEALELLGNGIQSAPGSRSLKGIALAQSGRTEEARAELRRLTELARSEYVSAYQIASVCAALGDIDGAFTWLDRAIVDRDSLLPTLRADPVMNPLRSDPRYVDIENKIGLPPR